MDRLKSQNEVVVLDVGGAAAGVSDYHRTKFESILDGELMMGLAAHNIGAAEAKFGADSLREIQADRNVPLVSANVFDDQGQAIAEPYRLVESGGQTFVVTGVLDPKFQVEGLQVREPDQSLLELSLIHISEPTRPY